MIRTVTMRTDSEVIIVLRSLLPHPHHVCYDWIAGSPATGPLSLSLSQFSDSHSERRLRHRNHKEHIINIREEATRVLYSLQYVFLCFIICVLTD